jgi:vitamin-K-epoxide reductase (warfarin-sensitive)
MRVILILLAAVGILASSLALREHYRTYGESPCSINDKWDCGIVNHSPYAIFLGIPVADIGIAGYLLMAVLAFRRAYRLLLASLLMALVFSLFLAHIEAHILGVWCIYCVASLAVVIAMNFLVGATVVVQSMRGQPKQNKQNSEA